MESERIVAKIEININKQLIEEYPTEASKKRDELERRNQKYRRELQQRRLNKWQKFKKRYQKSDRSKTQKVPQTTEQNSIEVKSASKNTTKLKLAPNIEDHANYISFTENKALELKKQ